MKAILVMFDSLNRHMLPPYGSEEIHAPNFERLAKRSVTFDQAWVGSMPCMPARRDLHTGRTNFLHRGWGPLEPYDNSMPRILREHGVHTHLVSDHYHYWESGGATYHTQYSTWEFARGQEGDPWKGKVAGPRLPAEDRWLGKKGKLPLQDLVNREYMQTEEQHPLARTFSQGLEFIETNGKEDRWFVQIEAFDPHEPFFSPSSYKSLYPYDPDLRHFDWPEYKPVTESPEEVAHCRYEYASLVSMCDAYLGKVLDTMDRLALWEDTMLIVTTDHGFLLGEHDWWAKNVMPLYNEISRIPLFYWDPRLQRRGVRCEGLTQLIDIAPTLLEYFGAAVPEEMLGQPLRDGMLPRGQASREAVMFGYYGAHVNVTDGRYVYMRAPVTPDNMPLYDYTLMPSRMGNMFTPSELMKLELADPFSFTKGVRPLRIPARESAKKHDYRTLLFDLHEDPLQRNPVTDVETEQRMLRLLGQLMRRCDAPAEQYERLGMAGNS